MYLNNRKFSEKLGIIIVGLFIFGGCNLKFYDDLEKLLSIFPENIFKMLKGKDLKELVEVVLDLGRQAEIRYLDGKIEVLPNKTVAKGDIDYVADKVSTFGTDNRAGIEGTLHRISAIKNRQGDIVGLTCRVGRVVTGTIDCIKEIVMQNKSVLFLGRPGVGKTTKLREIARLMSEDLGKRVVIVDTSNEIAGDGDIPHIAVGRARRMQVPSHDKQRDLMIEAVQNHTPEVIVVDEIGTEEEAMAARTIAERGVMLVATAHGNTLENIIKNPTLSDLVGGVNTVTLGDDEAKRRSSQKTILEREKKPTFDIVIEIIDRDKLAVYPNVAEAVDYILRGWPLKPEIRTIDYKTGTVDVEEEEKLDIPLENGVFNYEKYLKSLNGTKKIYIYAVSRSIVEKLIERIGVKAEITRNIEDADIVIAHKNYAKGGAKILAKANENDVPISYVRANTMPQIQKALNEVLGQENMPSSSTYLDELELAIKEAKEAIEKIKDGIEEVELKPQKQHIRRLQHELVEQYELESESIGNEPNRRLKIVKDK